VKTFLLVVAGLLALWLTGAGAAPAVRRTFQERSPSGVARVVERELEAGADRIEVGRSNRVYTDRGYAYCVVVWRGGEK